MYQIITGMSKKYYDLIGKAMVESWLVHWQQDLTLTIYSEDNLDIDHPRIKIISLDTMDEQYHNFQNYKSKKLDERMKTFAKKAWPIMKNLESNEGKLIWVDADVITHGSVTVEWLDSLLPKKHFSTHIGVYQSEFYAVETGFFIIDCTNKFKTKFLETYKHIYYNRDFSDMKKPFDGDVFGKVIRDMKSIDDFRYMDLNEDIGKLSPFNKIFKDKMCHFKAKRKYERLSDELPEVSPRTSVV